MVWGVGPNNTFMASAFIDETQNKEIELKIGSWRIFAVGWTGENQLLGQQKCGSTDVTLVGGVTSTINLNLTTANCAGEDFSASEHLQSNQFLPLKLISCNDLTNKSAGSNCDGPAKGNLKSYRIIFSDYNSSLELASPQAGLISPCFNGDASFNSVTPTSLSIPVGKAGLSPIRVVVESFDTLGCSGMKKNFIFVDGLKNKAEDRLVYSSGGYTEVFLKTITSSPNISYFANYSITQGLVIPIITPYNVGGSAMTWSATGLPIGLSINSLTGDITGAPTGATGTYTTTVTATNDAGASNSIFDIVVQLPPPLIASYTQNTAIYYQGQTGISNSPTYTGTAVSFSITPTLPSGLSLNSSTGVISGSVSAVSQASNYTITAMNAGGSYTHGINIMVVEPPPIISHAQTYTITQGNSISPIIPTNTGGSPTTWTAMGLPSGLSINSITGSIAGTTNASSGTYSVTVTASNLAGSSISTFSLEVQFLPPVISSYTQNTAVYIQGQTGVVNTPSYSGTSVSFTISPALPSGLIINSSTGVISGSTSVLSAALNYTITATNPAGSSTQQIGIAVVLPANLTITSASTFAFDNTAINMGTTKVFNVTNTGNFPATSLNGSLSSPFNFPGGFPGAGGSCTSSLAPTGVCTIVVDYAPTTSTAHTATLGLSYYNGLTTSTPSVSLTGQGCGWQGTNEFITVPQDSTCYNQIASNTVHSVFTKNSIIYAATNIGLSISSDGGITWSTKTTSNGLASNNVFDVFVDNSGSIYAGTDSGLAISTNGGASFTNKTLSQGLGSNYVRQLFVGTNGYIYAATNYGLSISTNGGATFTNKTMIHGLGTNNVNDVYVGSNGSIYAVTGNFKVGTGGLSISTNGGTSFTNKTTIDGLGSDDVRGVYLDSNGYIYVATGEIYNDAMNVFSGGGLSISVNGGTSFTNKTTTEGLGSNTVQGVYVDSLGTIYASTQTGLAVSTNGGTSFSNKTTTQGLGSSDVRGVYVDSNGYIYASTFNGLAISTNSGTSFSNKKTNLSLASSYVSDVFVDSNGYIYAATQSGLSISKNGGVSFFHRTTTQGLGSNNVSDVFVDSSGYIYAATSNGLSISTNGGNSFTNKTTADGLGSNNVSSIFEDSTGYIYVATIGNGYPTSDGGLSISTNGGISFSNITMTQGLGSNEVHGVYVDSTGYLYVATTDYNSYSYSPFGSSSNYGGLSISIDAGLSFNNITTAQGLGSPQVSGVYVDNNGHIYASTNSYSYYDSMMNQTVTYPGGISISTDSGLSFTNKTTTQGLGSNDVRAVYVKNNGHIYASTSNGLSVSTDGGTSFTNKTTSQGLVNNFINTVYSDSSGYIYAGTMVGLSKSRNPQ